jgi:eukaryotic-like serine/threonine-protein kinase
MDADLTGRMVLQYRVLEKLGQGGMGAVYRAEDVRLQRTVALKFLSPEACADPAACRRFVREAQAAGRLDHPNICTVYGLEEADGRSFIVMACIEGPTLSRKMDAGMTLAEVFDCAIAIAEGCAHAHDHGVVHRDLKAANVILSEQGIPRITDFGLARLENRSRLTTPGTIMGTITSMAPEQLMGQDSDRRTDIWAFGVLLYEMVTGTQPFERRKLDSTMEAILHETPPSPCTSDARLPRDLDWVFEKCLAKAPAERYQHIDEVAADLRAIRRRLLPSQETIMIQRDRGGQASAVTATLAKPAPPPEPAAVKSSGLGWPMWVGIAAVAAVVIALLIWLGR